jgi:hypothetical protein
LIAARKTSILPRWQARAVRLYNEPRGSPHAVFLRTLMLVVDIAVLTLHLLLAGIAAAGPIVAGVALWQAVRRADQPQQLAAQKLARASLHSLFTAMALGFLLWYLYRMQTGTDFAPRGERLSRLWILDAWTFWGELTFSVIALTVAIILARRNRGLRWLTPILLVVAGTNLLYHLPLRFSIFNLLQSGGLEMPEGLTRAIKHQWLAEPQLWARLLHHWGAMFVAAGLAWQWLGRRVKNNGAVLVLLGVAAQLMTGPWLLFSLPAERQNHYLGEQLPALTGLGLGIAAALLALVPTFGLAFDTTAEATVQQRRRLLATCLLVTAWVGMITGQLVQR